MSALTDLLDTLAGLEARAKALQAATTPVRAKATAMAIERYADEGVDRWQRADCLISVVKPKPHVEVTQPETLCGWLDEHGHDQLVTSRVEVTDHHGLAGLVTAILAMRPSPGPDTDGSVEWTPGHAEDLAQTLVESVDVRRLTVSDWTDHLQWQPTPDGTLVTPDGEVIPGCRHVAPQPERIQVRPSRELVEAAAAIVAGDLG